MTDRSEAVIVELVPELRAKRLPLSSAHVDCTTRAADLRVSKVELEDLLRSANLGRRGQGRETARVLACDEKTLRRWRDPRCQADLAPPDIRTILAGRAVEILRSA